MGVGFFRRARERRVNVVAVTELQQAVAPVVIASPEPVSAVVAEPSRPATQLEPQRHGGGNKHHQHRR